MVLSLRRLSRLFSVLLLQYGAQAAQILLVGGGERGSVLCTMLAGGNSVMSIQGIDWAAFDDAVVRTNSAWLLSICKAHAVTLLVGLISGLIEMLSTEENIRIWLNLNGSLDSLPAIHKMLSYTVRVLIITLAPSDSDCLGGNTVRHRTTQVGDIHTSSAVLTHTLAPALFDIIHKLDKSSIHPKWFMLIFDRSACMGAEVLSDDLIGKEKLAAATALQCWVRLLNDCSTSAVVKQSVSCLEPTIDSTPRLVFRKEQLDEDSDWEWEDQKESSIELNADAQSSQIEISPPHFVATDGIADIASVQPMDYSKTTVVEQDEDTLAIDNPLREDSKPALALMSQADLNSIRRSLKIIRCTIDDIKSCGASYDGAVKKID